jgi:hypothetical protein
MSTAVAITPDRDRATGPLLVAGIVIATLTEAIASTVLSLGRNDMIGDIYAPPDEFAWLDIGYTALKLTGFMVAPWLMTGIDPRRLIIWRDAGHGRGMRHCCHHSPAGSVGHAERHTGLFPAAPCL